MTLDTLLDENILVPADLRRIFGGILDRPEFVVWEKIWKDKLQELLTSYKSDATRTFLTLDHLVGEGEWLKGQQQAATIPSEVLKDTKDKAKMAFIELLVAGVPAQQWATMRQMPGENISQFAKRLQVTLEKEMPNMEARNDALISILRTNTIPACRQAIMSLPRRSKPTLGDILEVCMQVPPDPIPPNTRKSGTQAFSAGVSVPSTLPRKCFNCGELGHFAKNGPKKTVKPSANPTPSRESFAGQVTGNI